MTRPSQLLAALLSVLALALPPSNANADDATELERAKTSYDAGRYAEGVERFKQILSPQSPNGLHDPTIIQRARAYYAACLIALGRDEEANALLETIIRTEPRYALDPVVFPGKVIDRFLDVKERLKGELEKAGQERADAERAVHAKQEQELRAYIETLQQLASRESVVVRHSRWIAALPFGIGQFQNQKEGLGYAFLATEALLAVTSITAGVIHMQLVAQYPKYARGTINFSDFESRRKTSRDVSVYSSIALAMVVLGGIVEAELNFVPEVHETRIRPIPLAPVAIGIPGGLVLGAKGSF
jgi:tetratricopeptide (TPR) repeat protein